jgi:hypothetical protein
VAEAVAREVVVAHLDDQPRGERLPLAGALGAPAAGPARRAAGEARRRDQRLEPGQQRLPGGGGEAGGEAHVVEQPVAVVEPEEQRAHHARARREAEAADHAVGGAAALDLLHAGALPALIRQVEPLGHDAVEGAPGHVEPGAGLPRVRGGGREPDVVAAAEVPGREGLEEPPPLAERPRHERAARRVHQQVEDDEHRRPLSSEPLDPARGGMDALEQVVEGEAPVHRHHDLAVEHEGARGERAQMLDHLREVAGERLPALGLQLDPLSIAEGQAAEAVPLGLVLPARAGWYLLDEPRLHRRVGRAERQAHRRRSSR